MGTVRLFMMTVIAASVIHCAGSRHIYRFYRLPCVCCPAAGTVMIRWHFLHVQSLSYGLWQQSCSSALSPVAV